MNGGAPATHTPAPSHVSTPLQMLLSAQLVPAANGACTTPVAGLHESAVHGLPSSMTAGAPTHAPAVHWSAVVHALPSLHAVPLGALRSAGQLADAPLHDSERSHTLTAGRHTTPAWPAGCWHATLNPLHWSAVQGLPSSLHAVPLTLGEHVPASPDKLHALHSPVHATSQQTPLAQNPVAHCVAVVHGEPREGS
jgi:hypothetical protein